MIYFKKEGYFYCKFDPSTFTFIEALSAPDQARIMSITNEQMYLETIQRVQNHGFLETTEQEFDEFLRFVIDRLNPQE